MFDDDDLRASEPVAMTTASGEVRVKLRVCGEVRQNRRWVPVELLSGR